MPVNQWRLLPLLAVLISGYFGVVFILEQLVDGLPLSSEEMEGFQTEEISPTVQKYSSSLSHREFWRRIQHDAVFLAALIHRLRGTGFKAFFFETPPVTASTLDSKLFEFVIVEAPELVGVKQDSSTFSQYFKKNRLSISFENLGGDAVLVAPVPNTDKPVYSHLALFVNEAPAKQVRECWKHLAKTVLETVERKGNERVWISTSGLGVYWLHFRLDSRPKYYQYQPYKRT